MRKVILALLICLMVPVCACSTENDTTSNLSEGQIYVVKDYIDPETGVHYLMYKEGYGGGIAVRYNADGSIMVEGKDSDKYVS